MAWLNSSVGIDSNITEGFERVRQEGNKLEILGRSLQIAPDGLPAEIFSFFGPSNQYLQAEGEPLIDHPFRFVIEKETGEIIREIPSGEFLNLSAKLEEMFGILFDRKV